MDFTVLATDRKFMNCRIICNFCCNWLLYFWQKFSRRLWKIHVWRVDTNLLNKQSRTADRGWFASLGVGRGVNSSSPWKKKQLVTKCYTVTRSWMYLT